MRSNRLLVTIMLLIFGMAIGSCVAVGWTVGVGGKRPLPPAMAEAQAKLEEAERRLKVDRDQLNQLQAENDLVHDEIKALKSSIGGNPDGLWNSLGDLQGDIARFGAIIRATDKWARQRGYVAAGNEIPLPLPHEDLTEFQGILNSESTGGDAP